MSGRLAFGVVLLAAGTLWLLSAAEVVDLGLRIWVGVLLIAIGLAIALTRGRHRALVLIGVLVALAGVPALLVEDELYEGGVGESVERPASSADLEPYRQGIGKLTVDLTEPGLPLDDVTVEASVGIGELVVLVPPDTDVTIDAHAGVGNIEALGETESGIDVDVSGISGTSGAQELELELEVGIGHLRVEQR
ncbi:MAG: LiaF domain-containing protein [Gaiellaceae bacterium]